MNSKSQFVRGGSLFVEWGPLTLNCSVKYNACFFSLTGDRNSILELREEHGVAYQRSFPGCQLIDWLLQNGEAESRREGLGLCRALQEHGIIQHGEGSPRVPFGVCCQSEAASIGWPDLKRISLLTVYEILKLLFCALSHSCH